jgi:hypothetical protein
MGDTAYIEGLYAGPEAISKEAYIAGSGALDFTPVVDDDVARFLMLMVSARRSPCRGSA